MLDHRAFQEDCLRLFVRTRDVTREIILPIDPNDPLQVFLATQLDFYSQRCITVSHLLRSGLFWDAEMIFRAAIESAVKMLFVVSAPEPERSKRVDEFRHQLAEISTLRYRSRASRGHTDRSGPDAIFSHLAMSEDELRSHNAKWTKKERKALEQKWAFAEIVKDLDRKEVGGYRLSHLSSLVHSFGVASHFLHADQMAIDLSLDRERRSASTKEILELLHFTEMLTRMCAVLISCSASATFAIGTRMDLQSFIQELIPLNATVEGLRVALYEAEREYYTSEA